MYGDEMEGDDDRNDGLNALVNSQLNHVEFAMGDWFQQRHRPRSPQLIHRLQQHQAQRILFYSLLIVNVPQEIFYTAAHTGVILDYVTRT